MRTARWLLVCIVVLCGCDDERGEPPCTPERCMVGSPAQRSNLAAKCACPGLDASMPGDGGPASNDAGSSLDASSKSDSGSPSADDAGPDAEVLDSSTRICRHRFAQSGICDDPEEFARCESIVDEDSCAAGGCWPLSAQKLDTQLRCSAPARFVPCTLQPEGCSTVISYADDPNGGTWLLSDSCHPRVWSLLQPGLDALPWPTCSSQ